MCSHSWPAPKIRSQVSKLLEDFLPNHPDFKLSAGYAPESSTFFSTIMQALRDHGQDFLVGDQLSWADIQLLEVILMAEECKPSVLAGFPLLQVMLSKLTPRNCRKDEFVSFTYSFNQSFIIIEDPPSFFMPRPVLKIQRHPQGTYLVGEISTSTDNLNIR